MRIFSGQKSPDDPGRQKAQGAMASNLAMPGLGSLAAGQKVGLLQLALGLGGFALTVGFGMRFVFWGLAHLPEYYHAQPDLDPFKPLRDLWQQARWPLLGILMFGVSWVWALATSRSLLAHANRKPPGGQIIPHG